MTLFAKILRTTDFGFRAEIILNLTFKALHANIATL